MRKRSNRNKLGMDIAELSLPRATVRRLQSHGIVTCAQLFDHLTRVWHDRQCRQMLGMSLGTARTSVGGPLNAILPSSTRHQLAEMSLPTPPVTGVAGPCSENSILRRERLLTRHQRSLILRQIKVICDHMALPSKVMLDHWMTPVGNQGSLGSCVGWSVTTCRDFFLEVELAALFAYALAKLLDGHPEIDGSWQIFAYTGMFQIGHVLEQDMPYTDRPRTLDISRFKRRAAQYKIRGFTDILLDDGDRDKQPDLFRAVLAGEFSKEMGPQPISISIAVFESLQSATTAQHGLITVPLDGERRIGGHAMTITGYIDADDSDGLFGTDWFIVKNSWGTSWASKNPLGMPGYALIPANYFKRSDLLWEAIICHAEPSPAVLGPQWSRFIRTAWNPRQVEPPPIVQMT